MDSYKILKQALTTTSWVKLYSVPEADSVSVGPGGTPVEVAPKAVSRKTQTLITSIIACGQAADVYSIGLRPDSGSTDPTAIHLLVDEKTLSINTTDVLSLGLTLGAANSLWVKSGINSAVSITIMGIETT